MDDTLCYGIFVQNDVNELVQYRDLKGNIHFTFHEVIAINPHNIIIHQIYCSKSVSYSTRIYLYSTTIAYGNTLNNIQGIMGYVNILMKKLISIGEYNNNHYNEILHFIELWLTKFVPHTYKK